jgi:hypothetical protein
MATAGACSVIPTAVSKSKDMGERGVNGDAHPGLTLGRSGSEREIDEGAVVLVLEQDRGPGE